ncbi:glycosyltransferase [Streptomyces sp. H27-C3]|uniref:glycosyltransferase n=1 Tax=Streptomyces sp. H27-C3 TaxID=3046305 RepID=UPI0024B997D5|nr:glycosyltransferase [Streptomyces sp. H27-C3]MDJ0463779.1 glycosyltransferase [Streptomyces sp. H27-C3]
MTDRNTVRAIAVVLPARNEQTLLPAALDAVRTAAQHPALDAVQVLAVVAADCCTDATAAVARDAGALVVPVRFRNVGRARATAVCAALASLGGGPDGVWIASTDADSTVPPDWAFQLARAQEDWDAVVGTVSVDHWPPHKPRLAAHYHHLYEASRPPTGCPWRHPHVHGANLGVAARAYTTAGGFPPLPLDEDHGLVAALERTGARILRTSNCPVTTSSRTRPRTRRFRGPPGQAGPAQPAQPARASDRRGGGRGCGVSGEMRHGRSVRPLLRRCRADSGQRQRSATRGRRGWQSVAVVRPRRPGANHETRTPVRAQGDSKGNGAPSDVTAA